MSSRRLVAKTYKLYLDGSLARSESGRHRAAVDHTGALVANVPRASRKDVRDAVKAARESSAGWSARTAYNRGQILYRLAEALESRAPELARVAVVQQSVSEAQARAELGAAVDVLVHCAGWTDKLGALLGSVNQVVAPYHSVTTVEPTGVVAILAPDAPDLLGLVWEIAAVLAAGNVAVALVSERWPLRSLDFGEVAGISDVPRGVVNLLSGERGELLEHLCGHRDVNAIVDATGLSELRAQIDLLAADTVKRVLRIPGHDGGIADGALGRLEAMTERRTAWHPVGV
ncbi:MAG: aldehyde dehydrogenase family protein [Actinomycetota bacterium]|nr:aldehyde dehydrogenase family protein [Actinomycetota bacterium]